MGYSEARKKELHYIERMRKQKRQCKATTSNVEIANSKV